MSRIKIIRSFASNAAIRQAVRAGAPETIRLIQDGCVATPGACAFIREIGGARRIFPLNPYFTSDEMEGMAYRIKTLTKNESLSTILIATDQRLDNHEALPSLIYDRGEAFWFENGVDEGAAPEPGKTFFFSGGYDPLELYKTGKHRDPSHIHKLFLNLQALAAACRGDTNTTKIPTITIPHGTVTDAGFAWLLSSYVLSTRESAFRITNPSKGLSLDPVGLSFFLPRMGQEFGQESAQLPGCGLIMGLMGYTADCDDMLLTGMSTHDIETVNGLGLIETILSELPSWHQQGILQIPKRDHGQEESTVDHNAFLRNRVVADAVNNFASARADGTDMFSRNEKHIYEFMDPSLDTDPTPFFGDQTSMLVNYAATFDSIFQNHNTITGLLEAFREVAGRITNDPLEQEGIDVAADFVTRLERQSPLAVTLVHQLLMKGSVKEENLQRCASRERHVQAEMYRREDFAKWAEYTIKNGNTDDKEPFMGWKHKSLADISMQEVQDIMEMAETDNNANEQRKMQSMHQRMSTGGRQRIPPTPN